MKNKIERMMSSDISKIKQEIIQEKEETEKNMEKIK
jgi:hypothetical protein